MHHTRLRPSLVYLVSIDISSNSQGLNAGYYFLDLKLFRVKLFCNQESEIL